MRSALFWVIKSVLFLWCCGPTRAMVSSFLGFLDHTQRRNTVTGTPLDEWSARRRELYLTKYNIHNRKTSIPPAGFEPTNPADERPQTHALDRPAIVTGIALSNIPEERRFLKSTKLRYSGVWCRVVWYTCTEVPEKLAASIIGYTSNRLHGVASWMTNLHGHYRKKFNYRKQNHKEHM